MEAHLSKPNGNDYHTQNGGSKSDSLKCSYKSPLFGGYFLTSAPCYSTCGLYIFVSNASRVHVYNSKDLSYKFVLPPTDSIINIAVYCCSNDYLLVLSRLGKLIVYRMDEEYSSFDKFAEYSFTGLEMLDMKVSKFGTIFLVTRHDSNTIGICKLQLNFSVSCTEIVECRDKLEYICKFDRDISCFAISYTGEMIAVSVYKLLMVFKVVDMGSINMNKSANLGNLVMYCTLSLHQITTLSFHPRQNYLASGDITGKVITWHIKQYDNQSMAVNNPLVFSASSVALNYISTGMMSNEVCHKRMGCFYLINNPDNPISPHPIAESLISSENSGKSQLKTIDKQLNAVNDGSGVENFIGLLECDTRVLHWHAHAINSLVFTNCGRFMLTGGEEAVVVIWDLENGTKRFITRLESTIFYIVISTVDNIPTQYLVSCGSNCVKTFDPILLMLKHTIFGIQVPIAMSIANFDNLKGIARITDQFTLASTSDGAENIVCVKPMRRNIYFQSLPLSPSNSTPYGLIALSISGVKLQFFSVVTGVQHSYLDFIDSNYVSRSQEDFGFTYLVEEICISRDCSRIVASSFRNMYHSDRIKDSVDSEKRILRFWHKKHDELGYIVNTQVNNVHITRVLNIIELSPDSFVSVSTYDWKLWSFCGDSDKWSCTFAGSFKGFTNYTACLSIDKSLMAVSHGMHLSFWYSDCQSLLLHKKLSNDVINCVCFVDHQHLLTATAFDISIWDIFSGFNEPIQTYSYTHYKITQLVYNEVLPNVFVVIVGDKTRSKLEVFQINTGSYSFRSIHAEEQCIPNGYIACCLAKLPLFAVNTASDNVVGDTRATINGVCIEQIVKSSDYLTLLVVLLNNLEFRTYTIDVETHAIRVCEYLVPSIASTGNTAEKRHLFDGIDVPGDVRMGQSIKRASMVRPFEEDCPTFALPSPNVVFHRMVRSLLKPQNSFPSAKNGM